MSKMVKSRFILYCCFSSLIMLSTVFFSEADEDRKVYIAYMGALPHGEEQYSPQSHHLSLLEEVLDSSDIKNSLVRSYHRSFNGFAARLTEFEKDKLARMKEVVSIFPSRTFHPETTRSWDFMGLNEKVKRVANVESSTIIGILDTGIWPELPSFDDKGFGPAPKKWKGVCEGGQKFKCNNKVIGARYYTNDTARDMRGHGTHTASIAAGNRVEKASFYGLAEGSARGGVPSARLAIYKVCDASGCDAEALFSGMDDAIADGVDILSVSLGGAFFEPLSNPLTIGSFHAMQKGILFLNSVGNTGPGPRTVSTSDPWILSVAASSTDRMFIDKVVLGNKKILIGKSVNSFSLNGTKYPMIYGSAAATQKCSLKNAEECMSFCLDPEKVKGKIVLCDKAQGTFEAKRAGAVGSIVVENLSERVIVAPLPSVSLNQNDFDAVKTYLKSEKNPIAEILKSETVKSEIGPIVAPFSSRGPSRMLPDILKPDLTAPGVNILAGYSPVSRPSTYDSRHVNYNVLSGTSAACPHVAGAAAYVKTFHQDWSPAAIKSALMTTAWPMDASKHPDAEFAYGSGHIDPVKAVDPGLVYDALEDDYLTFLCALGYADADLSRLTNREFACKKEKNMTLPRDLNYPSLSFRVQGNGSEVTFRRTVTNVGNTNSTYKATIGQTSKLRVKVDPEILSFKSLNEKKRFTVTVIGVLTPKSMLSTFLEWSDGIHKVRSPIVLYKD